MAAGSGNILRSLITLLLGLCCLALVIGGSAYVAFTFSRINQAFKRQHEDTHAILSRHSGLKEIPYAAKFWAKAVEDHSAGVLGPAVVTWIEQTGVFRLLTMQSKWTMAIFTGLAALAVYCGITGGINIINGMVIRRENSKALGDNLLAAIQAVQGVPLATQRT